MKDAICKNLAYLASLKIQYRYVVNGDSKRFLIPSEIVEDVNGFLRQFESRPNSALYGSMTSQEKDALASFISVFDRLTKDLSPKIGFDELIKRDATWAALRSAARVCLDAFHFDLRAWERKVLEEESR